MGVPQKMVRNTEVANVGGLGDSMRQGKISGKAYSCDSLAASMGQGTAKRGKMGMKGQKLGASMKQG